MKLNLRNEESKYNRRLMNRNKIEGSMDRSSKGVFLTEIMVEIVLIDVSKMAQVGSSTLPLSIHRNVKETTRKCLK